MRQGWMGETWPPSIDWQTYASATQYKGPIEWENPVLTRLKTHFSLICNDFDTFDGVEPKLYRKNNKWVDYTFWVVILLITAYFSYKIFRIVL